LPDRLAGMKKAEQVFGLFHGVAQEQEAGATRRQTLA
jgi:hypothetical protein